MGAIAAWAGVAVAAGSAAYGAKQNSDAAKENEDRFQISRDDYETRLKEAAKWAATLETQYNDVIEDRPGLSWGEFVKDKVKSLNDPALREAYTNAKEEDFDVLRQLAKKASTDNLDSVVELADKFSGGKWREAMDKRNELVLNNNAAERYARAYELAAPIRGGASTVKYDNEGRLIEGQRADKQAFNIATEVQTEVDREQKADIRALQQDYLGAAERQNQKATDFMGFFDATGYATAAEADRTALLHGYQQTDEERAFDMFKMFAGAASGITPTNPQYVNASPGNELISSGVGLASSSLSNYYGKGGAGNKNTNTKNPYAS